MNEKKSLVLSLRVETKIDESQNRSVQNPRKFGCVLHLKEQRFDIKLRHIETEIQGFY